MRELYTIVDAHDIGNVRQACWLAASRSQILTFDAGGVSGHPNHAATFRGAQLFARQTGRRLVKLLVLETTSVLRKYLGVLDLPISLLTSESALAPHLPPLKCFRRIAAVSLGTAPVIWVCAATVHNHRLTSNAHSGPLPSTPRSARGSAACTWPSRGISSSTRSPSSMAELDVLLHATHRSVRINRGRYCRASAPRVEALTSSSTVNHTTMSSTILPPSCTPKPSSRQTQ